jgi:cysteine synthase A
MSAIPINIADHVGRTPLVQLTRLLPPDIADGVQVFGKLEAFNPGGSVKDRIGVSMLEAAEREGRIEPGRTTIVEATSGNTGIALAFVCAAKGYDLVLTLPEGMSRERERLLSLYGARVEITESLGGMNEAVDAARAMATRDDVFLPDQFSNPANPEVHRRTTAPEILESLDGKVDVFVDEVIPVGDEEAIETARACARAEGILVGLSCGAALWASVEIARRPESAGKRIVCVLPDSGERYVSIPWFSP